MVPSSTPLSVKPFYTGARDQNLLSAPFIGISACTLALCVSERWLLSVCVRPAR